MFSFEATGQIVRFTDNIDPAPRSRKIFHFFKLEMLISWLAQPETLRLPSGRIHAGAAGKNLCDCQIGAVTGLEKPLVQNKFRALVHMATGVGRHLPPSLRCTVCSSSVMPSVFCFWSISATSASKRIRNSWSTRRRTVAASSPSCNVQRLVLPNIDPHAQACISSIQRMYSILSGEPIGESAEDMWFNEVQQTQSQEKPVRYNPMVPV